MIGILSKFECKQCGMIITKSDVLIEKGTTITFKQCDKCGCGAKSGFILLDFKPMEVGLADRNKEELLAIPNELHKDMREFMMSKLKERQNNQEKEQINNQEKEQFNNQEKEQFNNQEKDNLEEERENED